jgi:pyruvate ferredoxin oxidoreductase alpha subunit
MSTVIAGLGGRAITRMSLRTMLAEAVAGALEPLSFLDLNKGLIEREFIRARRTRRSGPVAENMLRDQGLTARIG